MSGRLLPNAPALVELSMQRRSWASRAWQHFRSVFASVSPAASKPSQTTQELFVALGTTEPFEVDAPVDQVGRTLRASAEIVRQIGSTTRQGLPGTLHTRMNGSHLLATARFADCGVSHAGAGTAIERIELVHCPTHLPQRASRGEHADKHQPSETVGDVVANGLSEAREVNTLTVEDLSPAC